MTKKIIKNNIKSIIKGILKDLHVLYIEDEENIRKNITKTLKLLIKDVTDISDTTTAFEILQNKQIDLIICDINMPNENGIEFIKRVRQAGLKLPVTLLSASTDKEYLLEATRLKLVDYLVKPIDFHTLQNTLENAAYEILESGKYIIRFEDNIFYNFVEKKIYKDNEDNEILLTSKELELLDFLILNDHKLISQDEIKENIWEDSDLATDSALKNLLNKLRKKIGKNSIKNISGFGYKIHYNN
ncbi:response regulator transcription factor [Arcobacter sp.]|uniref:response regulator transcription factor n=1 Tax=Arcobacter sp. TaxID=1872629 RepID=UPI003D1100A6